MQSDDAHYCLSTLTSAEIEIISEMLQVIIEQNKLV